VSDAGPDAHRLHQESCEVHALDPGTGAGFVCATGRFPDRLVTWAAVTAGGHAFVEHSRDGADTGRVTFADGVLRIEEDGARVEVEVVDLHPETPWRQGVEDLAHGHVETSCRVRGVVQVGDREVRLDGALAHRDRSWGPRDLTVCLNHRWFAGTCGTELCFSFDNLVLQGGVPLELGYVVRSGVADPVVAVDIEVATAYDCLTPRSVVARAVCESGAEVEVRTTRGHQTFLDVREGWFTATDRLFEVECEGLPGIADLNLTVNPQAGRSPASLVQRT
jgi:hypothetical protein